MANGGAKQPRKVGVWAAIGLTALAVVAAVFGRLAAQYAWDTVGGALSSPQSIESQIDRLSADPRTRQTFSVLKSLFPSEYASIKRQLAAVAKSGGDSTAAQEQAAGIMHRFMMSHIRDMANASSGDLVALAAADRNLMQQLRSEDVSACADFAMRGLKPTASLSDAALTLIDATNASQMRAAYDGMRSPVQHPALTSADVTALLDAMKQHGASQEVADAFGSGSLAGRSAADQCTGGVALYAAITALPTELGGSVMSALLSGVGKSEGH